MSDVRLNAAPCFRCGCHLAKAFDCFCGAVHDDHCVNCGRWLSLPPEDALDLGLIDELCTAGPVDHQHTSEEKERRIAAVFARVKETR